jgi:hypothetical protein
VLAAVQAKPASPVLAALAAWTASARAAVGADYARNAAGREEADNMALQVGELSLELIETLRPVVPRIKAKDRSLADQITRAASSIALNIGDAS